ncbi:MAG: DNA polymerase IV [Erysipelotrichaceae bacterium]|nr:DNA polymerase IV [Erysipelotrichaceae bacterium]
MNRVILHCDLNCFFASVEMLYYPELRNVPMAIGGDQQQRHGIILAKNVPAKKKGIKTAETIIEAKRKCPELIIRKADYESYAYFSGRVKQIYYQYTDKVEPFGIDECWLDISESISYFGSVEKIVNDILSRIRNELGLTISIGIADNRYYAKLGSDIAKEDSFFYVRSLKDIEYMSADCLFGVGRHMYETLKTCNIKTIGELARKPLGYLVEHFGKYGQVLHDVANGFDHGAIMPFESEAETPKSISHTVTSYKDICNLDELKLVLTAVSERVASDLRSHGLYFNTVHIFIRDNRMKARTIQETLKENSDLAKDIFDVSLRLFMRECDFRTPFRAIGVAVSRLSDHKQFFQTSLFEESGYSLKQKKKEQAMDDIRRRFGDKAVLSLRMLQDRKLSGIE